MKSLIVSLAAIAFFAPAAFAEGCENKNSAKARYAEPAAAAAMKKEANIVETAAAAGTFNTLIAAAKAAGLADALMGEGPLTVFAPTDAAFAALPAGTVDTLLKPENKTKLADILKVHVIAGQKVKAADLAGKQLKTDTLNGKISIDGRMGVKVNDATVIAADVAASNGIIHVIDRVLMPAS
jgi:uncharacterized surface protein with fasciclin (FAS1) repeats